MARPAASFIVWRSATFFEFLLTFSAFSFATVFPLEGQRMGKREWGRKGERAKRRKGERETRSDEGRGGEEGSEIEWGSTVLSQQAAVTNYVCPCVCQSAFSHRFLELGLTTNRTRVRRRSQCPSASSRPKFLLLVPGTRATFSP